MIVLLNRGLIHQVLQVVPIKITRIGQKSYILQDLSHSSLISIGTMCDAGRKAVFDKENVYTKKYNQNLLIDKRGTQTVLWMIPLEDGPGHISNVKLPPIAQFNAARHYTNIRGVHTLCIFYPICLYIH